MKTTQKKKPKTVYSELVLARGSRATVTCFLSESQRQAEEWDNFMIKEREAEVVSSLKAVGLGKL